MRKLSSLPYILAVLSFVFCLRGFGQVDILNATLRTGSNPSGWVATNLTFSTGDGGYANFSVPNSDLTSPILDLTGYSDITLTFSLAKSGTLSDGPLTVQFSNDGGITWTDQTFDSPTPMGLTYLTSGPTAITASGSNVRFRLSNFSASVKRVRDIVFRGTPSSGSCGYENFDNSELLTGYTNGSFVGNNGVTWTYVQSRNENGDENNSGISGNAIMLRRSSDDSKITSNVVSGGISDFSVKLYKGFTGSGNRQVELFVNGVSKGTSTAFDDYDEHIFEVTGINILGDVIIEIKNITAKHVIIDDITWTCGEEIVPEDEPSDHPTNFDCLTYGADEIDLYWDDAIGDQLPEAYLILWSELDDISDPEDGTPIPDGSGVQNVPFGEESFEILGLNPNTQYYFKIFPYTNSGENIDYKSDEVIPSTTCTTDPRPCGGLENFDNAELTASYSGGSFVGNDGVNWTYVDSRDENNDDNGSGIDGNAIMFKGATSSKITSSTIAGGIADFSVKLYKGFTGNGNRQVELFVNGVSQGTSTPFNDFDEHIFNVTGINILGDVIIEIRNTTERQVILDDMTWSCFDGCFPSHTIASISPQSGPRETLVTITGTDFIAGGPITDVIFGDASPVSPISITDTEITVSVPADATTGPVILQPSNCIGINNHVFTFLKEDCAAGDATLIISELCDPELDYETDRYIEIYNPSDVPVNLNGWTLYSLSNSSNIDDQSGFFWSLSGMIGAGEALTCGYSNPENGGPHSFPESGWNALTPSGGAFSWNGEGRDGAALYNGGTRVDAVLIKPVVKAKLYKDKVLLRNSDICSSNPISPLSEWTVSSKTNAGSGASTPRVHTACELLTSVEPLVITSNSSDISAPVCSQSEFNVAATPSSGVSSQWYYNDGSASWTEIIDNEIFSGATTSTLTVVGLTGSDHYQFYCQLTTDPTCINYSRAIQLVVLENDKIYFRPKTDGLWSIPNTWEFSSDWTNYTDACIYPNINNAELIEIETGNTVTYDLSADTLPSIWVFSGGVLETQNTSHLIIDDVGTGAEFIVEGKYIDNGNTTNSIKFLNDATWELGSNGTIVKTNSSYTSNYRDAYNNGITNIPATANWIYRNTGNPSIEFGNSAAGKPMYYPNLILENTQGAMFSSPGFKMSGIQPLIIKGYFEVGRSGNILFPNVNINENLVLIEGELIVNAGSELLNTDGNANYGSGFEVQGEMNIEGTLDLTSGTIPNQGILKLSGVDDFIGVGSGTTKFNQLIIDKDPASGMLSELNFDIYKSATFTQGILELEDYAAVSFQPTATTSSASNASFVDGKVIKHGTSEDFTFPIGDVIGSTIEWYQPARIFDYSGSTVIEAQYFAEAHPEAGPYYNGNSNSSTDNREIGNCDFWTVKKVSGNDVKLALNYENMDPEYCNVLGNASAIRIFSFNPDPFDMTWSEVASGNIGNEIVGVSVISAPVTGGIYGDFAFGGASSGGLNVLPIQLTHFSAKPQNQKVQTAWTTETETNNAFFTVERSADARLFQEIGKVTGAGTSHTPRDYGFTDQKPLPGLSYYRLKQTDFDGHSSHSDIVSVSFTEKDGFSLDLTYRDDNDLNLVYNSISPYILVEIFDVLGKRVFTEVAENYGGRSVLNPNLGRGAYVVRISAGDQWDSGKIVW